MLGSPRWLPLTFADTGLLSTGDLTGKLGSFGNAAVTFGILGFVVIVVLISMFMKTPTTANNAAK